MGILVYGEVVKWVSVYVVEGQLGKQVTENVGKWLSCKLGN